MNNLCFVELHFVGPGTYNSVVEHLSGFVSSSIKKEKKKKKVMIVFCLNGISFMEVNFVTNISIICHLLNTYHTFQEL